MFSYLKSIFTDSSEELDGDEGEETPTEDNVEGASKPDVPIITEPNDGFKVPVPMAKPSIEITSDSSTDNDKEMFPMVNGPQRANAGVGIARQKKPLARGHSALDWSRLTQVVSTYQDTGLEGSYRG
jgi:hypothetical protein